MQRLIGRLWLGLMTLVAISSFFICEINLWGQYSPIHLLSLWTLIAIGLTIYYARSCNIKRHKNCYGLLLARTDFDWTFYPATRPYHV